MAKNLTKRSVVSLSIAVLALSLGSGCSHHKPASSDQQVDAANVPPPDAGTDAVPQGAVEDRSGDTAGNVPPPPSPDNAGDTAAPPPAPTDASAQPPAPDTADMPPTTAASNTAPAAAAQTAANAPAPDVASTTPPADTSTASSDGTYTVKAGDTLMKIAFENYGDLYKWKDIYDANKDSIKNANDIPPGTVLKVEKPDSPVVVERNGDQYLIKSGDTLGTISNDVYGTPSKWKKIWNNNKQLIKDPNKIYAGFYLYYTMTPDEKLGYQKRHNGESPSVADTTSDSDHGATDDTDSAPDTRNPASVPDSQPQATAPQASRGPASVTPVTNTMTNTMPSGTTAMGTDALTGGGNVPPPPEMVNVPPPAAHSADLNQVVQTAQQEENSKAAATSAGP